MIVICAFPTQSAPPVTRSQLVDPRVSPVGGRPSHAVWGWLDYRCCGDQCGGRHDGHARETCVLWLWGGQSIKQPNQLWNLSQHGYGSSYCYYHNSTADNGGRGGGGTLAESRVSYARHASRGRARPRSRAFSNAREDPRLGARCITRAGRPASRRRAVRRVRAPSRQTLARPCVVTVRRYRAPFPRAAKEPLNRCRSSRSGFRIYQKRSGSQIPQSDCRYARQTHQIPQS